MAREAKPATARAHESRWALGAALIGHTARREPLVERPDPGLSLTGELRLVRGENSQLWLGAEGATWRSHEGMRTVALRGQFGYRLILGMGLGFELWGGPGLASRPAPPSDVPACTCPARRGFLGGMGAGLLYDFGQVSRVPVALYARYEAFLEWPLRSPDLSMIPHQGVQVGVRFTIPGRR